MQVIQSIPDGYKEIQLELIGVYDDELYIDAEDTKGFIAGERFFRIYKNNGRMVWFPMLNIRSIKFIPKEQDNIQKIEQEYVDKDDYSCETCLYRCKSEHEEPCKNCCHNYVNHYRFDEAED